MFPRHSVLFPYAVLFCNTIRVFCALLAVFCTGQMLLQFFMIFHSSVACMRVKRLARDRKNKQSKNQRPQMQIVNGIFVRLSFTNLHSDSVIEHFHIRSASQQRKKTKAHHTPNHWCARCVSELNRVRIIFLYSPFFLSR